MAGVCGALHGKLLPIRVALVVAVFIDPVKHPVAARPVELLHGWVWEGMPGKCANQVGIVLEVASRMCIRPNTAARPLPGADQAIASMLEVGRAAVGTTCPEMSLPIRIRAPRCRARVASGMHLAPCTVPACARPCCIYQSVPPRRCGGVSIVDGNRVRSCHALAARRHHQAIVRPITFGGPRRCQVPPRGAQLPAVEGRSLLGR